MIRRGVLIVLAVGCAGSSDVTTPPLVKPSDLLVWRNSVVKGETVPVFDSTAVYNLQQAAHVVSAVNRQTGALLWSTVVPTSRPDFDGYGLTIAGGVLVVGDLDVFGLDRATGAVLWKFSPTVGQYPGFSSLTSDGTTVFCGSTTGHVYAVDGATGKQLWVTSFLPQFTQVWQPILDNGVVYVGFTQLLAGEDFALSGAAAFDAKSGAILWLTFAPQPTPTTSIYNDHGVAVTPTLVVIGSNYSVFGLDRATGKLLHTVNGSVFADAALTLKVVRYTGSLVVVGNGAPGTLTALDPNDLHMVWRAFGDGGIFALGSDESRTYVARVGAFDVYRTSDGVRLWRLLGSDVGAQNEFYLAAPAFDATRIYLPGTKGVYAFKKQ